VANARILQETPFEELYIQPSAGDGGGALGAALFAWHCALGNTKRFVMDHTYWGEEHTADAIRSAIEQSGVKATLVEDQTKLVEMTVERLTSGQVVGWHQGRFEWGPRALGNRSILADPRDASMKDLVNNKIKFREPFRPFAPAVLAESSQDYFDLPQVDRHLTARFMLLVVPVREDKQDVIPAVNHMGTARLQTVYPDANPRFHELINGFASATGVPILLNTSFNVRGEPIVNTPKEALNTFLGSGIDTLVMGNYLINK
jgi:carbamoyltransferase